MEPGVPQTCHSGEVFSAPSCFSASDGGLNVAQLVLRSGPRVEDPARLAARMLGEEWPYYDGVPMGDWDRVEPMDVLATVSVNSFVTDAARVRRVHHGLAAACDGLLAGIPREAHVLDGDLAAVERLLAAACGVPGVLVPVATKVLHRKRPHLIPMLDNVVLAHYFGHLGRPELVGRSQDKRRAASTARIALQAFGADLEGADPVLADIAGQLAADGTPVTAVRLLELLVWCAVEPAGYYRQLPS